MDRRKVLAKRQDEERRRLIQLRKESQSLLPFLQIKGYENWPRAVQDAFLTARGPEPTIVIHASAKNYPDIENVVREMHHYLDVPALEFEGKNWLTPRQFFTIIYGMHTAVFRYPTNSKIIFDQLDYATEWFGTFITQVGQMVFGAMLNGLYAATGKYSRIDRRMYWFTISANKNKQIIITVGAEICPTKMLTFADGSTTVYRIGWGNGREHLEYIDLDASLVGGPQGTKWPLYAHRHVFHRLEQRLTALHEAAPFYMWESLRSPVYAGEGVGGLHLFEYRYSDIKLGYLGIEIYNNLAIVKTFYFLTMRGMKERKLLVEKLRVSGDELEWHGLDDLSAFVDTDLFDDPHIAQCLRECGCGDLERFRSELRLAGGSDKKKKAEHLKRYLKFNRPSRDFDIASGLG